MSELDIPARIKEAIRHDSLVLFIGSGYSRNLSLPDWLELARKFVDALVEKDASLLSIQLEARKSNADALDILNSLFKSGYKDDCKSMLRDTIDIDVSKHDLQNQQKIWRLSRKVVTTNYDRALEGALTGDLKEEVDIYTPADNIFGLSSLRADLSYLFKIHGTITRPEGCVLFPEDYDRLYKHNHRFLEQLKGMCANATVLFIGYSIADVEIQQILKHIKSLFHTATTHFILSTDKKAFEALGIRTIALENYGQLIPFVDALIAYREKIDTGLRDIRRKVTLKYQDKKTLIDQFGKENEIYKEKERFLDAEDKKEILTLESLDSVDGPTSQKKIAALIEDGKEDQVRTFLLLKRKAKRQTTWAYFRHLEEKSDKSSLKLSLEDYTQALNVACKLFGEDDYEVVNLYNQIGSCHFRLENLPEAERHYLKARAITEANAVPNHLSVWMIYNNLGNLEDLKGNSAKALEYHQKALTVAMEAGQTATTCMRSVAQSFLKQKRYAESIALLEQIVRDDKEPVLFRANDYQALGLAYARRNQEHEAVLSYQQAVKLFFDYYGEENKQFLELYNDIGWSQLRCQEYENAIDYFKKVIALETNDENTFIATNNIGEAYYSAGNFKMAKKTFEDNFAFLKSKISKEDYPEAYNYCRQNKGMHRSVTAGLNGTDTRAFRCRL